MRLILIILILVSSLKLGFGQNYSLISFGLNKPIKYSIEKPSRNIGFEIGYYHGFKLKESIFFEAGFSMDCWGKVNEESKTYYMENNILKFNSLKRSYINFSFDLPFLINYRHGKINVKNGISIYLKNSFTKTTLPRIDPEIQLNFSSSNSVYSDDFNRLFGLSYQIRFAYSITDKIAPYLDFKTSILSNQANSNGKRYGILNFGMIYKIASH